MDKDGTLDGQGWNIGWTRMEHWKNSQNSIRWENKLVVIS